LVARLTTLLCKKKILLRNPKKRKPDATPETSEEGYGSKRAVLPIMVMMMNYRLLKKDRHQGVSQRFGALF
jgi:hypothetical protein